MTAALNGGQVSAEGLKSANMLLGKALNDPIAGLAKLTRAGVTFTEGQKDQIKAWVEHGQIAKAQGLIIAEVNREFGGSAEAAATPAQKLAVAWGNMQEVLGNLLIPAIDRAATVLGGTLEVVDENRTAFGILFGVLATGAAVIGTLIVAGKIHKAVTEGITVATEAWALIQKGLNISLGVTTAQTGAATVATEGLTVATGTAGAAAKGAAGSFGLLAGSIGLLTAGIGLGVFSAKTWIDTVKKGTEENEKFGGTVQLGTKFGGLYNQTMQDSAVAAGNQAAATQSAADATKIAREQQALAQQAAAALNTQIDAQVEKLKPLKEQFAQQSQAIADTIESYDGLITKSDVTTKQVITDLKNQVTNFKTYSADVKRLIKAGVDPKAIEELSQKGPQFIHALAEGSKTQLDKYKGYWKSRQDTIKGSFATSMGQMYADLKDKITKMQREINRLKGKTIFVGATAAVTLQEKTRRALLEMGIKGYGVKFLAEGGMTRLGQTAIVGEEGPELVQFQHPAKVYTAKETRDILSRGMAGGGLVGGFGNASVEFARRLGTAAGERLAAVAGNRLSTAVANWTAVTGSGGGTARGLVGYRRGRLPDVPGGVPDDGHRWLAGPGVGARLRPSQGQSPGPDDDQPGGTCDVDRHGQADAGGQVLDLSASHRSRPRVGCPLLRRPVATHRPCPLVVLRQGRDAATRRRRWRSTGPASRSRSGSTTRRWPTRSCGRSRPAPRTCTSIDKKSVGPSATATFGRVVADGLVSRPRRGACPVARPRPRVHPGGRHQGRRP